MLQPTIKHAAYGEEFNLYPTFNTYGNGRLAISFEDIHEGPYGHLTINMPNDHLNPGEVFVKNWSVNEGLVRTLIDAGWINFTGREVLSGFVAVPVAVLAGPLLDAYTASQGV